MSDVSIGGSFDQQRRLRLLSPRARGRPDLRLEEIPLRSPLDLDPPRRSWDQRGRDRPLPPAMPETSRAPLFTATLQRPVVAVAKRPRCYLLTGRGELIRESVERSGAIEGRARKDWPALAGAEVRDLSDPRHLLLAGFQRIFGYWHWWIDVLPRIWLADEHGPEALAGLPLGFPELTHGFQRQSLDLLRLAPRVRELRRGLTRFGEVSFTPGLTGGHSRWPNRALAAYAEWLRGKLAPSGGTRGRRILVSRGEAASRRIVNEPEVGAALGERGFELVEPGRLPLADQIALFAGADAVVGVHGAGLTNLLFSAPGAQLIEIFPADAALDISNYRALSSHLGIGYSSLLATPVPNRPERGAHLQDLEVDLAILESLLTELGL